MPQNVIFWGIYILLRKIKMTDSQPDVMLVFPANLYQRKNTLLEHMPYENKKLATEHFDEKNRYHNENGPAYTTSDVSYFLNHGEDWSDEEYEIFIKNKAQQLFPEENLTNLPLSQLVSIVHTTEGWEPRGTYNRPAIDWGELLRAII